MERDPFAATNIILMKHFSPFDTLIYYKDLAIKNFRGYSDEINSDFEDLTAFVGKNDIGKSTILEALDIFFNDGKGVTKLDKADLNVESKARQETDISIRVCFTDLLYLFKSSRSSFDINPSTYDISILAENVLMHPE